MSSDHHDPSCSSIPSTRSTPSQPSRPSRPSRSPESDGLGALAAALRELTTTRDVRDALQLAVELAVELIRGIDAANIALHRDGASSVLVATDDLASTMERIQREVGEGPCLTAAAACRSEPVVAEDLASDPRWPTFAPLAVEHGVRSAVAYELAVGRGPDRRSLGTLNLFGREARAHHGTEDLADLITVYCAVVLHGEVTGAGLRTALESRDVIGQAKGVLMERHSVSADEAYEMLRAASNDGNVKLRVVAARVVERAGRGR